MTQTQAPSLRTRAVNALAEDAARQATERQKQEAREKTVRADSLVYALRIVLHVDEQEAHAAISADAECAVLDGIYFENTTRTNSNAQLRVYVDLQGDEGAERHDIRRLTDLGTLIEEYGDGNLIDPRGHVTVINGDVDTSRLLSPERAAALIAADPEWAIYPE